MGEHLECNPCGGVAACERCHRFAGPEVLLSLLPNQPGIIPGVCIFSSCSLRVCISRYLCSADGSLAAAAMASVSCHFSWSISMRLRTSRSSSADSCNGGSAGAASISARACAAWGWPCSASVNTCQVWAPCSWSWPSNHTSRLPWGAGRPQSRAWSSLLSWSQRALWPSKIRVAWSARLVGGGGIARHRAIGTWRAIASVAVPALAKLAFFPWAVTPA